MVYLVLSRDKLSKRQLARSADPDEIELSSITSSKRLIFVRHGESTWNYVFNRGFFPSFLLRWLKTTLMELYLIPSWDSSYIDSPLSDLGIDQCHQLREFLEKPCAEPNAATDFELLTKGEGRSVLVSSQLRRAAATLAIGLTDRLQRTREPVYLHSACQEISRNFDTQSLAPMGGVPSLKDVHDLDDVVQFNGDYNDGNKTLSLTGVKRLQRFAEWVSERPDDEEAVIVAGHSLWFRSFFQLFLPRSSTHICKKRKIVNCGAIALTLQRGFTSSGAPRYRIDPSSIVVIYGGFATK